MTIDLKRGASYRARAVQGKWLPEERILRLVSQEFRVPASSILAKRGALDIVLARHVWLYLCAITFPGGRKETCERCKVDRFTLRYALARVEDMRDDPAFDARIERLEALIAAE